MGEKRKVIEMLKEVRKYLEMGGDEFAVKYFKPHKMKHEAEDSWAFRVGMASEAIRETLEYLEAENEI